MTKSKKRHSATHRHVQPTSSKDSDQDTIGESSAGTETQSVNQAKIVEDTPDKAETVTMVEDTRNSADALAEEPLPIEQDHALLSPRINGSQSPALPSTTSSGRSSRRVSFAARDIIVDDLPASMGFPEVDGLANGINDLPRSVAVVEESAIESESEPNSPILKSPPPASVGFPPVDGTLAERSLPQRQMSSSLKPAPIQTTKKPDFPSFSPQPSFDPQSASAFLATGSTSKREDSIADSFKTAKSTTTFPELSDDSDDESDNANEIGKRPAEDPTSLTLSIFSKTWASVLWRHKVLTVLASLGINLLLPFVNGVMLGFGEIFAREWISIYFNIGPNSRSGQPTTRGRPNVSTVGVRAAGAMRGGNVQPEHAGAKTALETATEAAILE